MNTYEAVMKAADHIETHPHDFNFHSIRVPDGCGTPGCALGWVGFFAKRQGSMGSIAEWLGLTPEPLLGHPNDRASEAAAFYNRMDTLCGYVEWMDNPTTCANTMRLYAQTYLTPDNVVDMDDYRSEEEVMDTV